MAQVAIITASDSGIGKECALLLAQQGFDIGITWHSDEEGAKDTAREVVSHGVRAEIVQLDLGKLPEGAQALEKLIQRLGRIDVLVNNAGAMTKAPFLDMAFDEWRKIFTVDVDGAFLCSQIAARQMVKQGQGGRIINITSVHEHTPLPDASAYTAAKHALGGLTKTMALELVRHKILVNAVAPGAIATPMNGMDDSDVKPDAEPSIPLRRFGATHEIASLVAWLCSEGANYTTGQSLIVDVGCGANALPRAMVLRLMIRLFLPAPFQPPAHAHHQNHDQNQPDPVLQMLVEIVQPRRNHLTTSVTNSGKNQRPGKCAENIQRQKDFRRQLAGTNQRRANHPKAIHKARTNDKQIRMALDKFLRPLNFILMFRETA